MCTCRCVFICKQDLGVYVFSKVEEDRLRVFVSMCGCGVDFPYATQVTHRLTRAPIGVQSPDTVSTPVVERLSEQAPSSGWLGRDEVVRGGS